MAKKLVITIDGPAGAGKSTVSQALAVRLSYLYLDTGAIYRAIAYKVMQSGIRPDDDHQLDDHEEDEFVAKIDRLAGHRT